MTPIERLAKAIYARSETYPHWALGQMNGILADDFARAVLTELRSMAHDPGTLDACLAATNATNNYIGRANARTIIDTFIDRILNEGGGVG
jgi:hypothetical protein